VRTTGPEDLPEETGKRYNEIQRYTDYRLTRNKHIGALVYTRKNILTIDDICSI
jgi:hypothetical protein